MTTENTITNSPPPISLENNIGTAPPVVETPIPVEVPPEPVATDPVEPVPVPPSGQIPDWFQKRFNELVGKRNEAERLAQEATERATAAEKLLSLSKTPNTPATPPTPGLTEEEVERRAKEKATEIFQAENAKQQAAKFNETCNTIVDTGKKEFKDWDDAVKNLNMVGAIGSPDKVSPEFLETVVELKNPHQILHHLGMHPEDAARIAGLPAKKMALELARVEATLLNKQPEKPIVSSAPAPVIPLSGKATPPIGTLDDPNMPSDEWFKVRAQQLDERKNRYRRN